MTTLRTSKSRAAAILIGVALPLALGATAALDQATPLTGAGATLP